MVPSMCSLNRQKQIIETNKLIYNKFCTDYASVLLFNTLTITTIHKYDDYQHKDNIGKIELTPLPQSITLQKNSQKLKKQP
jgi:hypothetical protein